jgi:hypothetical protein
LQCVDNPHGLSTLYLPSLGKREIILYCLFEDGSHIVFSPKPGTLGPSAYTWAPRIQFPGALIHIGRYQTTTPERFVMDLQIKVNEEFGRKMEQYFTANANDTSSRNQLKPLEQLLLQYNMQHDFNDQQTTQENPSSDE